MRRVLITGGGHSELPLIQCARKLGLYVITTGTNADGLGHKAADKYVFGDYSDREFVKTLAEEENVSAVISGCNDFAYLSAAYACGALKLPGHDSYETSLTVHNKDKFREVTRSLGIKTPRSICCYDLNDVKKACRELDFPLVIKPVDLTGGKGVEICRNESEALKSAEKAFSASNQSRILAEEYVDGKSYGTSCILKNHKVVCSVFGNEYYFINKYLVAGACSAGDLSDEAKNTLCSDIEKISRRLGLCDGLFHTQFVVDKSGAPVIIDPCRRAPGDLYVRFAQYVTGADFPEMIVKSELGMDFEPPVPQKQRYIARMCVMTDRNGTFERINISDEYEKKIVDKMIWANANDKIEDFMKYKAGILFLEESSAEELYRLVDGFYENVKIRVF